MSNSILRDEDVAAALKEIRDNLAFEATIRAKWDDLHRAWWKAALPIQAQNDAIAAAADTIAENVLNWPAFAKKAFTNPQDLRLCLYALHGDAMRAAARPGSGNLRGRLRTISTRLQLEADHEEPYMVYLHLGSVFAKTHRSASALSKWLGDHIQKVGKDRFLNAVVEQSKGCFRWWCDDMSFHFAS